MKVVTLCIQHSRIWLMDDPVVFEGHQNLHVYANPFTCHFGHLCIHYLPVLHHHKGNDNSRNSNVPYIPDCDCCVQPPSILWFERCVTHQLSYSPTWPTTLKLKRIFPHTLHRPIKTVTFNTISVRAFLNNYLESAFDKQWYITFVSFTKL